MDISIFTSSPEAVDPAEIADALEKAGYLVISVDVNEGERVWTMGEKDTPNEYGLIGPQAERYDVLMEQVGDHDAALADARQWPTEES